MTEYGSRTPPCFENMASRSVFAVLVDRPVTNTTVPGRGLTVGDMHFWIKRVVECGVKKSWNLGGKRAAFFCGSAESKVCWGRGV